MPVSISNDVPKYACLREASAQIPGADPSMCDLLFDLLQTGDLAARREADFLARHGLNQTRLIVLVLLDNADAGSMRSSELAGCAEVSRATMTGLLDTLEKAGLVARAPDPHDRRVSNVKITTEGECLLRKVHPLQSRWAQEVLAPLSRDERDQLVSLLHKVQEALAAGKCPVEDAAEPDDR